MVKLTVVKMRESVDGGGKEAEQAMRKLALLDTTWIPLEVLSRSEKQAVEGLLTQHALVTKDDKGLVAMHALTQRAVRGLTDAPEREALVAAVAGALHAKLVKFDFDKPATYFIGRRYAAHARAVAAQAGAWGLLGAGPGRCGAGGGGVRQAAGGGGAGEGRARFLEDVIDMCIQGGNFSDAVGGQYGQALEMFKVAQDCALALHGPEHRLVADTNLNIGNVYESQGRYEEALVQYGKAQEVYVAVYGDMHPDVTRTQGNIANVHQQQGNYEEELFHYGMAQEVFVATLGHEHPLVADIKHNKALAHKKRGEKDLAKQLLL